MPRLLIFKIIKFTWVFYLFTLFTSCESDKKERNLDALDIFLNEDFKTMERENYSCTKNVDFMDKSESKTYSPIWNEELDFLNDYLDSFRKNNEFTTGSLTPNERGISRTFTSLNGDSLVFQFKNQKPSGFNLTLQRQGMFRESKTELSYQSLSGLRLVDYSSVLYFFKNNVVIISEFNKPNK